MEVLFDHGSVSHAASRVCNQHGGSGKCIGGWRWWGKGPSLLRPSSGVIKDALAHYSIMPLDSRWKHNLGSCSILN